jgi:hypothetical protein
MNGGKASGLEAANILGEDNRGQLRLVQSANSPHTLVNRLLQTA